MEKLHKIWWFDQEIPGDVWCSKENNQMFHWGYEKMETWNGESLLPLIFVLCMILTNLILRKVKGCYEWVKNHFRVNQLLFIDNQLSHWDRNQQTLESEKRIHSTSGSSMTRNWLTVWKSWIWNCKHSCLKRLHFWE